MSEASYMEASRRLFDEYMAGGMTAIECEDRRQALITEHGGMMTKEYIGTRGGMRHYRTRIEWRDAQ